MLLKAKPYQMGGETRHGKTHKIDEETPGRTYCGKTKDTCPGDFLEDAKGVVDCRGCITTMAARVERKSRMAQYEVQRREQEAERQRQQEEWDAWYQDYKYSPAWQRLRGLVMQRAEGVCEGCAQRRCTQVRHLNWKRVGNELLFDLAAVCEECSEKMGHSQTCES
jgi:hypothetical protein